MEEIFIRWTNGKSSRFQGVTLTHKQRAFVIEGIGMPTRIIPYEGVEYLSVKGMKKMPEILGFTLSSFPAEETPAEQFNDCLTQMADLLQKKEVKEMLAKTLVNIVDCSHNYPRRGCVHKRGEER